MKQVSSSKKNGIERKDKKVLSKEDTEERIDVEGKEEPQPEPEQEGR